MSNINNNNNTETKKVGFISSKDYSDEQIAKLPKIVAKVCRSTSKKSKSTYYQLKLAIYRDSNNIGERLVIVKAIPETLAKIIAKRKGKDFSINDEFVITCSIRYSKGKKQEDDKEYFAYDVWPCQGKRLFDFFTTDEMDYLNDYGFKLPFEERVYFDEDGYKYESLDF